MILDRLTWCSYQLIDHLLYRSELRADVFYKRNHTISFHVPCICSHMHIRYGEVKTSYLIYMCFWKCTVFIQVDFLLFLQICFLLFPLLYEFTLFCFFLLVFMTPCKIRLKFNHMKNASLTIHDREIVIEVLFDQTNKKFLVKIGPLTLKIYRSFFVPLSLTIRSFHSCFPGFFSVFLEFFFQIIIKTNWIVSLLCNAFILQGSKLHRFQFYYCKKSAANNVAKPLICHV